MTKPILFNLTIKLSRKDSSQWLNLMKSEVLPQCTDGSIIQSSQINRILLGEEDGDETFAVQFVYASEAVFAENKLSKMSVFLDKLDTHYKGKYVYFATMMEVLHHLDLKQN